MIEKSPCFRCKGRVVGCHSDCQRYLGWKAKVDEEHGALAQLVREEADITAVKKNMKKARDRIQKRTAKGGGIRK